ncbi:4Fe-4S dicluster domain-containing protein [Cognatilysobacter lacus]|uniref:4Fe-4S binding protein n=1 Tax=Cognatilysobacter lacus TaxID=1643323 RepID=A0A5D8Z6V7_9GAMM|nr:4Fe-4S dicluster domain-containing protein [Lysobacter lacus]TZF90521.1 4Fe-4S binding protein [Lysobacter lacus]
MSRPIPLHVIDEPAGLYASERKVYPRSVHGRLNGLRVVAVVWLLGMFYVTPWLQWNGRQAVLFDLPARQFHIFAITFWPQDFLFLALLMIVAALALFFFTALAGRLWCGYACPQTVWTEVFLWIESWTEGDRAKRLKLDAGAWTREKILRKGGKHVLWATFALWTGFTFVGFFKPIADLAGRTLPFGWSGWETFWVLFYAVATWGNAGFLREQVCKYMCPYARFQGAMFDRNTLIIAYDPMRGEPRGPRKRGLPSVLESARGLLDRALAYDYVFRANQHPTAAAAAAGARGTITFGGADLVAAPLPRFAADALGDCIDCTVCVQVCPTGIDIRNGLQYECIACGACIDGCDEVMGKLGYPTGLIRYTTQNAIDGRPTRIARPRILVYGAMLVAITLAWTWGITHRAPLTVEALRDRNALYRPVPDGIENGYQLKLANRTDTRRQYRITLTSAATGMTLRGGPQTVAVPAQAVVPVDITVHASAATTGRHALRFNVDATDGSAHETVDSSFFGPL